MLEKQFNAPYRYDRVDQNEGGTSVTHEIPDEETFFKTLSETTNGGVGFRYSLSGEAVETETGEPYAEILFSKSENEPGKIRIFTWLQDIPKAFE